MSELQISLMIIGIFIIAGVLLFNYFQQRSYRGRMDEQAPAPRDNDMLAKEDVLPSQAKEPMLPADFWETNPVSEHNDFGQSDESLAAEKFGEALVAKEEAAAVAERSETKASGAGAIPSKAIDASAMNGHTDKNAPTMDYIATVHATEPISEASLAQLLEQTFGGLTKPVRWRGLSPEPAEWRTTLFSPENEEYSAVEIGLQLVDRNGPVSTQELSSFHDRVQYVAEQLYAVVDWPDKHHVIDDAQDLDAFCAAVDVEIGLNVVAQKNSSFLATKVRGLAEAAGMQLASDGRFQYRHDKDSPVLFSLSSLDDTPFTQENIKQLSIPGITLLLDVPKVTNGARVFDQMVILARQLANSLNGVLVDDNLKPLDEAGIKKIKSQLSTIHENMQFKHIPPGSAEAIRLFSN